MLAFLYMYPALLGLFVSFVWATPAAETAHSASQTSNVAVNIPTGGKVTGQTRGNVETFNGIPYADPPVGPLRLKPPRRLSRQLGDVDGTGMAPACPQLSTSASIIDQVNGLIRTLPELPILREVPNGQEDCLTVDVSRPAGTLPGAKLPVLFWIYGGAYQSGSTSKYDATSLHEFAALNKQPFIYVAVNYRLGAFGFLAGKEILSDGSSNLGLLDQRLGLEWVADNIVAFGGDPSKVTIWGESAGAWSVLNQMILYGGNATYKNQTLFRGAIMNSGSVLPVDPADCPKAQATYAQVVQQTGCSGKPDTLSCLRNVTFDAFLKASNSAPNIFSYQSFSQPYVPRPDGKVLQDSPERMVKAGKLHAVPVIIGDQEDEGTLFSLSQTNVTTADALADYLSKYFYTNVSRTTLKQAVDLYEPALTNGSPFRTSVFNEIYPGYKRVAAVIGDLVFQAPRRVVLRALTQVKPDLAVWSYQASYLYGVPVLGTCHASDLLQVFYGLPSNNAMASIRTYYNNFLYNLDPNQGVGNFMNWPQWKNGQNLLSFQPLPLQNSILKDDFRSAALGNLEANIDMLHF